MKSTSLDELLLDTKLTVPTPRARLVSRAGLMQRARESKRRVVAVTAPAGYGKTSFLTEWAEAESRPVIWVSLDHLDDDPVTLLTLIAAGYTRATGTDPRLTAAMRGTSTGALGRSAPRLASVLRSSEQSFVIMIDDLHQVRSSASEDVLSVIIEGVPDGSQFVATSRFDQPHVPRLRAADETLELGVAELALDSAAARHIFAEAQITLSAELADAVVERTEGWAVGIHLAAIIARESADPAAVITGDDRYVTDYLYRESLAATPPEVQAFLRRTSILDRFSPSLCDAVLDDDTSCITLRDLEATNTFLVPLDRRRQWYRYHPLFREFLRGELDRVEPGAVSALHLRAADWYEANGTPSLAVEHLLLAEDRERCIRLVAEIAMPTYRGGQLDMVRRWIAALGPSIAAEHPPLAVVAGWIALAAGQADEAVRWGALVDEATFDGPTFDGSASFESGRSMLRAIMCAHGPQQARSEVEFALAHESQFSLWRAQSLYLAGECELMLGNPEAAEGFFTEASQVAEITGNPAGLVLAATERAAIAMDRGHWVQAFDDLGTALGVIDRRHLQDYAMAALAFAAAARHALHRGDRAALERELTKAMRARPLCTYAVPALAVQVRLTLAKTYWAIGDHATARHLVHEIDEVLIRRPDLGALVDEVADFKTVMVSDGVVVTGGSPLTPAELRLLPYLQTHLTLPEIGARLFISRNTVATEVGSIYRKLGVSSRAEAVERSTAIGLLGE